MIEEVFKNLVDQFSDPFTCLRELVQNAMDAGTENIEISAHYLDDPGGALIEVRDYGSGMTRDAIDTKLTRLFASDKENDLTKIGKFGIGFVSVFSLKPELVIVDTGSEGEYWRIAFDGGTDFAIFHLEEPIEGTSVRIYKLMLEGEFDSFRDRAQSTIKSWCRHSAISITFNDETINSDLLVESPIRVDERSAVGRFNVGLIEEKTCPYGFYNSGLTLIESTQSQYPGVTYKILSNYLEHTLTRDAVIKDANYYKVMERLQELIEEDLFKAVLEALKNPTTRDEAARLSRTYLSWRTGKWTDKEKKLAIFKDVLHNDISIKELASTAKAEDRIFISQAVSPLAKRATQEGIPVLPFQPDSPAASLCSMLFGVPVVKLEDNLAISKQAPPPANFKRLEALLKALLKNGRIYVTSVVPVEYPDSTLDPKLPPCIFALGSNRLVRRYRKGYWATRYLLPQQLLLDVNHPLVRKAFSRLGNEANLRTIAYAICKSALLCDGIDPATESRLISTTLGRT